MEKNNFPNLNNIFHFIAVGFGSGLINTAPGTWGSFVALILFTIVETFINSLLYLFIIVFSLLTVFLISCLVASNDADIKDDSRIVSDEMGGMLLTLYSISLISDEIFGYLIGFNLKRLKYERERFINIFRSTYFFPFHKVTLCDHAINFNLISTGVLVFHYEPN